MTHPTHSRLRVPASLGKYRLHERIGAGGMAEVFRATLPGVGGFERDVAIKRMRPAVAMDPELVELFKAEARLAGRIHHKNVIQVIELGQASPGELYIVMEYVRGTDLRKVHEHCARAGRSIPCWLALHVVAEILDGLEHVHTMVDSAGRPGQLVHCDVTPENILIGRTGDIKLADFGVAVEQARGGGGGDKAKGKLPYMSPEQLMEQALDPRTDVFAAGVVLWESLTGRRLFPGRTPSEVMAQVCASPRAPPSRFCSSVPSDLDRIVLSALAADPARRPQSAGAFRRQLLDTLSTMGIPVSSDELKSTIEALLDAPVVHPDAEAFAPPEDDDYDELEQLDLVHEGPDLPMEPPVESPPRPKEPPPGASQTIPRMAPRRRPTNEIEELMRAYLEDEEAGRNRAATRPSPREQGRPPPTSSVLTGAAPLYARGNAGEPEGPLSPSQALDLLESHARLVSASPIGISVDRRRWLGPIEVSELLGERLLTPVMDGPGDLSVRGLVGLLGELGMQKASGRLRVSRERNGQRVEVEVHVRAGALTHTRWSGGPFEVWRQLFDDPKMGAEGLPEAFSIGVGTGTAVLPRVPTEALPQIEGTRARVARRWLERVVSWPDGRYRFDPSEPPVVGSRSQSIFRCLPSLVYGSLDASEAERRLRFRLRTPHRLVGFESVVEPLGLTQNESVRLRELAGPHPLGHQARRLEIDLNPRFVWAMTYLLAELGVLRPVGRPAEHLS